MELHNVIIFWSGLWPNMSTRPIGPYQLGHHLRKHFIGSQVIEFCQWYTPEQLVEYTEMFITRFTRVLGISTTFWAGMEMPTNVKRALVVFRQRYPHIRVVFGGPRADSKTFERCPGDVTIVGDAETKLVELIRGHNIGTIPFDITKLDHRFQQTDCILEREILPIELGRGCIFKCKFCGHHNLGKAKHTYQRDMELIEAEMVYNYEKFGTTRYQFLDDTVNEDSTKIKLLSEMSQRLNFQLQWIGYLRLDLLNKFPDTPYQLLESGLQSCFFGIETFHPTASVAIGKGWNGKHAKKFLPELYHDIWKCTIPIWNNFIVGLPYETIADLESTRDWCKATPMGMHRFVPLTLYTNRTDSGTKSFFTENYSSYGYTITEQGTWVTDIMSEQQAQTIAANLNSDLRSTNASACWVLYDLLARDVSLNNALQNQQPLSNHVPPFIVNYITKLRNISNFVHRI